MQMKKMLLLSAFLLNIIHVAAYDFMVNGLCYNVNYDGKTVTLTSNYSSGRNYSSINGILNIPSSVYYQGTSYSVTIIGTGAFVTCDGLTSIIIPNSVTTIGEYAFEDCKNLDSIFMPNSITDIRLGAFRRCVGLYHITIPNTIRYIGDQAFSGCNLSDITIPNSVTKISGNPFINCTRLKNIEIAQDNAVYDSRNNCNAIIKTETNTLLIGCKNSAIPNSITAIGEGAFSNCTGLTSITISNSVTSIGDEAFYNCSGLKNVTIGKSVTFIGNKAFKGCSGLTNITWNAKNCADFSSDSIPFLSSQEKIERFTFGDEVEKIPTYICYGMRNLTSVIIGNSVKSIGNYTFTGCTDLTSVTIPNSVTSIGDYAFRGCSGLTSIPLGSSVKSIGNYAFYECSGLTSVTIPNSVSEIGYGAFHSCSTLTSVIIPNSVTAIGASVFYGCSGLTSVTIGNSVTSIGSFAFSNCSGLTSVTIPNSVTSIGYGAFKGCNGLTNFCSLILNPTKVTLGNQVFEGVNKSICILTVPVASLDLYKSASQWRDFYNIQPNIDILASSVKFNRTELCLPLGTTQHLIATVIPENAYQVLNWSSSNTAVATVDQSGLITAKAIGTATITATTTDGTNLSASCTVTVYTSVSSISLNKSDMLLYCGESEKLIATITPSNATNKAVSWSSSNSAVATVDQTGKVTAKSLGTATITASTTDGSNLGATCKVEVVPILVSSLTLNKTNGLLYVGETDNLSATILPENATNKTITWSSTNSAIATVSSTVNGIGKVQAKSAGDVTITALTGDGSNVSATCNYSIYNKTTSISLKETDIVLQPGENTLLTTEIKPESTNPNLTWTSSDENVVKVDNTGKIFAKNVGTAIIRVTTTDGTNKSATCTVTVKIPAQQLIISQSKANVYQSDSFTLSATIYPTNTTNKTLKWISDNTIIASVDQNGVVTARKVGTATITCETTDGSNLSATCLVTVKGITNLSLDKSETTIYEGDSEQLTAIISPTGVKNKTLTWISSNSYVATVDQSGKITARAAGTARITATTTDGSNMSASCNVTVRHEYELGVSPKLGHVRGGNDSIYEMTVDLENRKEISGLQFMITVPDEVSLAVDGYGDYDVWLDSGRKARNHTVMVEQRAANKYFVLISSATNRTFTGNSGDILHLRLAVDRRHKAKGDYAIKLSDIVLAEPNETQHNGWCLSPGTIRLSYLVGDANADVSVDVADYVVTANHILGREAVDYFFADAANANRTDNIINVTDLVAITNIALELRSKEYVPSLDDSFQYASAAVLPGSDYAVTAEVAQMSVDRTVVNLAVDNDTPLAAMQFDLDLPDGVTIAGAQASDRAQGMTADIGSSADGKTRVILSAFGKREIAAGSGKVVSLVLQGKARGGEPLRIAGTTMTERNLTEHGASADVLLDLGRLTSIDGVGYDRVSIYAEGGNIVIESPVAGTAQLTRLNGAMQPLTIAAGRNVFPANASAGEIVIVKFNNKVKKIQF